MFLQNNVASLFCG